MRTWLGRLAVLGWILVLSAGSIGSTAPASAPASKPATRPPTAPLVLDPDELSRPGANLFTNGPIPRIQIEISREAYESLRRNPRQNVSATVKEGGKTYLNVALHLKGAAGSFRPVDNKPGMMLHFGRHTPDQRFHGMLKVMLNNSVQDPSYLNEKICGYLFRLAGVPSPRTGHAIVELNGRLLGMYVLKEDFHDDFLKRYFRPATGNLYDIKPGRDINQELTLDFGNGLPDKADLKAAVAACQEPHPEARWEKLKAAVDVERFVSMMAIEALAAHWDGYSRNRNNFRIYAEPVTGRLVFLPNDLDQLFRDPGHSIFDPGDNGLVTKSILQTPQARQLFLRRSCYIATNIFHYPDLSNRVVQTAFRLKEALQAVNDVRTLREVEARERELLRALAVRAETARKQTLELAQRQARFDKEGVCPVTQWTPIYEGGADLKIQRQPLALYIRAGHGGAPGFRSRLMLPAGRYRFEGRLRTANVQAVKSQWGAGAGLWVAGRPAREKGLEGTADWQMMTYDFAVTLDWEEVELVCELRAKGGEVWFDVPSLRLVKKL
ncbi:CotH kinase family protein [Fontisphaera persica]|uniref:CotH kinase family protein n=1 Tax=Fontisphaera persica TaxID=2974023 RepID=UPI0024C0C057|nr:CotH kinase family protein [Fontisphaera persica]WCJ58432.1 CotH kinase family protein [Fontisphaera persica]